MHQIVSISPVEMVWQSAQALLQVKKFRSPRAKRKRTVNSNKTVVEGIDAYLPNNRQQLTPRAPCKHIA